MDKNKRPNFEIFPTKEYLNWVTKEYFKPITNPVQSYIETKKLITEVKNNIVDLFKIFDSNDSKPASKSTKTKK